MVQELKEIRPATAIRETTSEERTWAAVAHASGLLTLLLSFSSAGLGAIPFVFVPLLIYLVYRDKSKFVAFHAAQAFVLQVVGTVGFFVFMILGVLITGIITVLGVILLFILIGILVLMLAAIVGVVVASAYPLLPLLMGVFAGIAAVETGNGRDYYYPYIGAWVADWLKRTEAPIQPAV